MKKNKELLNELRHHQMQMRLCELVLLGYKAEGFTDGEFFLVDVHMSKELIGYIQDSWMRSYKQFFKATRKALGSIGILSKKITAKKFLSEEVSGSEFEYQRQMLKPDYVNYTTSNPPPEEMIKKFVTSVQKRSKKAVQE